ncbi:MAG: hypothetical protein BWY79_01647 [Actinobacteria bacterium ADurb.Bin444]|nr:MAG: hypothetical protein BWY79_01647 [Actinobacteria bacterium ADurb.Bin444]
MQIRNRFAAAGAHGVGHAEHPQHSSLVGQDHHALALTFQCRELLLQLRAADVEILDQAMAAQVQPLAVQPALGAATGQGNELTEFRGPD